MNIDRYFKRIYNVAFRLTGDETKAVNLAFKAISTSSSIQNLSDKVECNLLNSSAQEVCRLFLSEYDNQLRSFERNTYADSFQDALMSLNPLSRTIIVWRDILGFNLEELVIGKYTKKELYFELNSGRKLIKDFLYEVYINETGA